MADASQSSGLYTKLKICRMRFGSYHTHAAAAASASERRPLAGVKNIDPPPVITHAASLLSICGHDRREERRCPHRDRQQQRQHHAQHYGQAGGQPSSPQRAQDGGEPPHRAPDTLAEPWGGGRERERERVTEGQEADDAGVFPWRAASPCVFSDVTLEKRDTWDTATNGRPSSWRKTPMTKAASSHR